MEFTKVVGKIDPKTLKEAEAALSSVFLDLGLKYDNRGTSSNLGGDALVFSLVYPIQHICTESIGTAATDGKKYYWNPYFLISLSKVGSRIVTAHEAWHAIYMHPSRRGSRHPKLWNIAVDYIVNGVVLEDFHHRGVDAPKMFKEHLGNYVTLEQYASVLKDPHNLPANFPPELKKIFSMGDLEKSVDKSTKAKNKKKKVDPNKELADVQKPLTDAEKRELYKIKPKESCFFADPGLDEEMKRPERIYEYLLKVIPKCPECGKIGVYKKQKPQPQNGPKKQDKKEKGDNPDGEEEDDKNDEKGDKPGDQPGNQDGDGHSHGDGEPCECPGHGNQPGDSDGEGQGQPGDSGGHDCGTCGGEDGLDVFDLGGLVDDHLDTEESEEKMAERIADAMDMASRMPGHIPAGLERELGRLTAPKITWKDFIRTRLTKAREGGSKNDWTKFRSRPLFWGQLTPKRKDYTCRFICCVDTSGSMSNEDMAFGISQLQSLDSKSEGYIVPADCGVYWDDASKLRGVKAEDLQKINTKGGGGTVFCTDFTTNYEKNLGKTDLLIIVTDGFLSNQDLEEMAVPTCPLVWLITSDVHDFKPPHGRVFNLRDL